MCWVTPTTSARARDSRRGLRESEERYRDLFENSNDLVQIANPDGLLVYVNSVWKRVLGYEDEEVTHFSFFDIVAPTSRAKCLEGFGFVKVNGCSIFLEDTQSDHRVVASVNECDQQGKAVVEQFRPRSISPNTPPTPFGPPFKAFLTDANMGNNLMDCAPKK